MKWRCGRDVDVLRNIYGTERRGVIRTWSFGRLRVIFSPQSSDTIMVFSRGTWNGQRCNSNTLTLCILWEHLQPLSLDNLLGYQFQPNLRLPCSSGSTTMANFCLGRKANQSSAKDLLKTPPQQQVAAERASPAHASGPQDIVLAGKC